MIEARERRACDLREAGSLQPLAVFRFGVSLAIRENVKKEEVHPEGTNRAPTIVIEHEADDEHLAAWTNGPAYVGRGVSCGVSRQDLEEVTEDRCVMKLSEGRLGNVVAYSADA